MVFSYYENLWPGGTPPDPRTTFARQQEPPDIVRPRMPEAERQSGTIYVPATIADFRRSPLYRCSS